MDNYHVIAIFTYPSDLAVVKTLLESNDIDCYVRDELTVQVHNFYSNAIGGIRLEIPVEKYDLAQELLIDNGFKSHLTSLIDEIPDLGNKSYSPLEKFIKHGVRFVVISVFILIVVIIGLIIFYE